MRNEVKKRMLASIWAHLALFAQKTPKYNILSRIFTIFVPRIPEEFGTKYIHIAFFEPTKQDELKWMPAFDSSPHFAFIHTMHMGHF